MDKIGVLELSGMEFFAHHGCFEEEQVIGNRYLVNLSISLDIGRAGESDRLENSVDYQKLYELVKEEMAINSNLIEHVAVRIINRVGGSFPEVRRAEIKISKLNPPIGGKVEASQITYSSSFE